MHERFETRIEAGLEKLAQACGKRSQRVAVIERRIGRLLERNRRAAGLFKIEVKDHAGRAEITLVDS